MDLSRIKKYCLPFFLSASLLLVGFVGIALASSEGGGHAAAAHGGLTIIDLWRLLNFVVLVAVLVWLLRKPVSQFLGARITGIREQLESLEDRKKAAEKELAEYSNRLAAMGKEGEDIIAQYRKQGEMARDKIMKEAELAAEKLEAQAKRNIEHEIAMAKISLETEIFEKALAAAEEKLKSLISAEDHERLIDEYLDKVVNQ